MNSATAYHESDDANAGRENTERYTHNLLMATLRERFSESEIAALGRQGAAMSEAQAIRNRNALLTLKA